MVGGNFSSIAAKDLLPFQISALGESLLKDCSLLCMLLAADTREAAFPRNRLLEVQCHCLSSILKEGVVALPCEKLRGAGRGHHVSQVALPIQI